MFQMLNFRVGLVFRRINLTNCNPLTSKVALYSRKSSSNQNDSFKIVGRKGVESRDGGQIQGTYIPQHKATGFLTWTLSAQFKNCSLRPQHKKGFKNNVANASLGVNPNWELLTPQGFRFYLPGNTGPAWQDVHSSANIEAQASLNEGAIDCTVQDCPILLRQGVYELFAGAEVYGHVTIVTLSQRAKLYGGSDIETEHLTKQFVIAAQDICAKLKMAGYWADFINPFSGLPYRSPAPRGPRPLFLTDERFRCLGFRVLDRNQCRVIEEKLSREFVGSLYTTAPSSTTLLREILQQYED